MVGERLTKARQHSGITQAGLALALGPRYDQTMVSHVEAGRKGLRLDGAIRAAEVLGVSLDYLTGLSDDPTPATQLSEQLSVYAPAHLKKRGASDAAIYRDIPVLEIAAAAGGGATVLDETPVGRISFQQDWLNRNDINALQSVIIKVQGESMEPTLPAGCSVLVDRSRRERQDGCVYVLRTEDGLVVKRLSQQGGHWRLLSDNPVWVPVAWTPETEIIGEVRWTARVL